MSDRVFRTPGCIIGARAFGWQVDYRPDGWLPLGVRNGVDGWHVLRVGRGCFTVGRLR